MLSRILLVAAMAVPMFAQYNDDWRYRRNDGYYGRDNYGYRDGNYGYGNGRYNNYGALSRAMSDLQNVASRARVDGHDRDHINRAFRELNSIQYQQGRVDRGRLDRVIEDFDHLARADRMHPRDRSILARDVQELRAFRSSGAYNDSNYGYGYGNDRYRNRW